MRLKIKAVDGEFTISKVEDYSKIRLDGEYIFLGKTDGENSLVCLAGDVPDNVICRDDGWRAFRIEGQLDFSLTGILSGISSLLAAEGIGIFALSTYDTDYLLTKAGDFPRAIDILVRAGYERA